MLSVLYSSKGCGTIFFDTASYFFVARYSDAIVPRWEIWYANTQWGGGELKGQRSSKGNYINVLFPAANQSSHAGKV